MAGTSLCSDRNADPLCHTETQTVTVAECAVPLQIVTQIPCHMDHGMPDSIPTAGQPRKAWEWRFDNEASEQELQLRRTQALDRSVEAIRRLQRSYHAWCRAPIRLATLERLNFAIPVVLCTRADQGHTTPERLRSLQVTRFHPDTLPRIDPLPTSALYPSANHSYGPFSTHLDLHREARVALQRDGDTRLSALLSGICAETLLDEMILHLMWEDGRTPEFAAQEWADGLTTRVSRELPKRLGGPWDLTKGNPAAAWSRHVAGLRNRVAHTGYQPTPDEAKRALETVDALVTHLCNRLANPAVINKYPRTALTLCGKEGLEHRRMYTRRISNVASAAEAADYPSTFSRWKEAWNRCRQDIRSGPRQPNASRSTVILLIAADGSEQWIVHDGIVSLAAPAVEPTTETVRLQLESSRNQAVNARASGVDYELAFEFEGVTGEPVTDSAWREEYHYLPLRNVMSDGSDRNR